MIPEVCNVGGKGLNLAAQVEHLVLHFLVNCTLWLEQHVQMSCKKKKFQVNPP